MKLQVHRVQTVCVCSGSVNRTQTKTSAESSPKKCHLICLLDCSYNEHTLFLNRRLQLKSVNQPKKSLFTPCAHTFTRSPCRSELFAVFGPIPLNVAYFGSQTKIITRKMLRRQQNIHDVDVDNQRQPLVGSEHSSYGAIDDDVINNKKKFLSHCLH